MDKGWVSTYVGLILLFQVQLLNVLVKVSGISFMKEGEITTPIHLSIYIIPVIFIALGIYMIISKKTLP